MGSLAPQKPRYVPVKPGATGSDLIDLASRLLTDGPHKILPTTRRVRVLFNGAYIVDTTEALMVWEHNYFPQYYVPLTSLQNCTWDDDAEQVFVRDGKVSAAVLKIRRPPGEKGTDRAVRFTEHAGELAGFVRLEFASMDQWLEEDTPIYVHPKDPFKRIDILSSTRPVEVRVRGKTVATSSWSAHLYETGLPTRYYLPLAAVDPSLLRKSELVTKCPYKGEAEYYHLDINGEAMENLVWYYRNPIQESLAIAGLVCFYNEKVEILVDGKAV